MQTHSILAKKWSRSRRRIESSNSKLKRKYDISKTPHQRLLESKNLFTIVRFLPVGLTLLRSQFMIVSGVTLTNLARSFVCSSRSIRFFLNSCPKVLGFLA